MYWPGGVLKPGEEEYNRSSHGLGQGETENGAIVMPLWGRARCLVGGRQVPPPAAAHAIGREEEGRRTLVDIRSGYVASSIRSAARVPASHDPRI